LEAEGGSGGKESAEISVMDLAGYNAHTEHPTGSKIVRAEPLSAQAEVGNVRIVVDPSRPWDVDAFLHEAEQFPGGAHDDQVDAASGAFNKLAMRSASVNVYNLTG
jgi:predicted phage terminase large subunit-like protein